MSIFKAPQTVKIIFWHLPVSFTWLRGRHATTDPMSRFPGFAAPKSCKRPHGVYSMFEVRLENIKAKIIQNAIQ